MPNKSKGFLANTKANLDLTWLNFIPRASIKLKFGLNVTSNKWFHQHLPPTQYVTIRCQTSIFPSKDVSLLVFR